MKVSEKKKKITKSVPESVNGIVKWIKEYRERISIDVDQLERKSRDFLAQNDVKTNGHLENAQKNPDEGDDEGWTVVSRSLSKTRQRMVPSTEKTLNRLRAKQKRTSERKELTNFYKFQLTDKKIDQLEQLKTKFELDKQRILQMRQQRKFKPF